MALYQNSDAYDDQQNNAVPIPLGRLNGPQQGATPVPLAQTAQPAATASPSAGMPQKVPVDSTPVPNPVAQRIEAHMASVAAHNPGDPSLPILAQAHTEAQAQPQHGFLRNFGVDLLQNIGAQFAPGAEKAMEARRAEGAKEKEQEALLPGQVGEQRAKIASEGAEVPLKQAQTESTLAEVPLREAQTGEAQAGVPLKQAQTAEAQAGVPLKQAQTKEAEAKTLMGPGGAESLPATAGNIDTLQKAADGLPGLKPNEKAALTSWPDGYQPTQGDIKARMAQIDRVNAATSAAGEHEKADAFRQLALGMERERLEQSQNAAAEKKNQGFEKTIERAQNANVDVNQPSPAGDYDLTMAFVEATKPSSGFRFTNTELQLIKGLRPVQGAAEAFANGITQGTFLSAGQRKDMNKVIQRAATQAQQKVGGNEGGDVIYARDPQGNLHQAPKGTALPQGWKQENR